MKIIIVSSESTSWSVDQDKKNLEVILRSLENVSLARYSMNADIIFLASYSFLVKPKHLNIKLLKKLGKKTVAVATNSLKDNQKIFIKVVDNIDAWVAASKENFDFLTERNQKCILLPFYVSTQVFHQKNVNRNKYLPQKFHDKYLIGSFQRDTEGKDLATPKWQKNPELIAEVAQKLDPNKFAFILAGPRRHYLIRQFRKYQISYYYIGDESIIDQNRDDIHVNNLDLDTINELYNLADLYIVTSKSEGGPKAVLEASLAKTPILSTKVGLAPDILDPKCLIPFDAEKIVSEIMRLSQEESINDLVLSNYKTVSSIMTPDNYLNKYQQLIQLV